MLSGHVIADSGATNVVVSNQDQVKLVLFFDCWRQLHLEVVSSDLS